MSAENAGETIKALQQYTGASIQIDQSFEPTAVTISGQPSAVNLAQVKTTHATYASLSRGVHRS
jgi:KH domain